MSLYYSDDAELTYRRTDRSTYGGGELFCKLPREVCAKPDGFPKRWLILNGHRWTLDSAHRNGNRFRPEVA